MVIPKLQFHIGLAIFLIAPFFLYKVAWMLISKPATGKVIYLKQGFGTTSQTYPVVQFETQNHIVTVTGNANLGYVPGDKFPILYNRFKETDTRNNTFWGCWLDTLVWSAIFTVAVLAIYVQDIVPKGKYVKLPFCKFEII